MGVKLAPAFYDREFTWVWLEVVRHAAELLEHYGLDEYNVLILSLPLGKDDLSRFKAKRIVDSLREATGCESDLEEIVSSKLVGKRFEIQFDPDTAIDNPREFAQIQIVDTLDLHVNPV